MLVVVLATLAKLVIICCYFRIRIEERIKKDNKSHNFNYLHSTTTHSSSYNSISYKTIDKANSTFDLKIKEPLHINQLT